MGGLLRLSYNNLLNRKLKVEGWLQTENFFLVLARGRDLGGLSKASSECFRREKGRQGKDRCHRAYWARLIQ